jgi:hypothetical protein
VEAEIYNSKLNFSVIDRPYNGVFNVSLDVIALISNGPIEANIASFSGVFIPD